MRLIRLVIKIMVAPMLKIDLHIHSIHSGHAYGTFYDIINEASRKEMEMIAITDHGPSMEGVSGHLHFIMGPRMPKTKLRVLWGCEANIVGANGELDLTERHIEALDLILVGFHRTGYVDQGKEKNTGVMEKVLKAPFVKVLTHPTHQQYECDFDRIVEAALENGVLPELNLTYLREQVDDFPLFKRLVEIVQASGKKLIVNSDAHFIHEIGDDSILAEYREKLGISDDTIINNFPSELKAFLGIE